MLEITWRGGITLYLVSLLVLVGAGELTGTVDIFKTKIYGCEARGIVMPCDSLSKYYSLENGKCYNLELGNKLCRSGWTQDFVVKDETIEKVITNSIAYVNNCVTGKTDKYFCNEAGKCISTNEILSELG